MAIIKDGFLRGQVGNLVNRKVGNQQIVQTKAGRKIKQSELSKAASDDFGYSSTMGACIRHALVNTHLQLHDDKMHNRLIKHIRRVIRATPSPISGFNTISEGNLNRLIGFQFNSDCHLHDYLYVDPTVLINGDRQVSVSIPAFHRHQHLFIPKNCENICIHLEAVGLYDKLDVPLGTWEIEISSYLGKEDIIAEQHITFDMPTRPLDTILVGLTILYIDKIGSRTCVRNSKELHPAAIIGGFNLRNL